MHRELCAYLQDGLDAGDSIATFTDGMTYNAFQSTDLVLAAVTQKFEVIGEALKQASKHFPGSLGAVHDAPSAISMRNRLAHGYFNIDPNVLWDSLKNDLPNLVKQIEKLKSENCKG